MTEPATTAPQHDIRPIVARRPGNRGVLAFGIALAIGAGVLFSMLEARRSEISSPAVIEPASAGNDLIESPPALVIPPLPMDRWVTGNPLGQAPLPGPEAALGNRLRPRAQPEYQGDPPYLPDYSEPRIVPATQPPTDPAYVYQDRSGGRPSAGEATASNQEDRRATASRFKNPSTTVPQGAVIQAVLETALDSNHPGYARGIVSYDVMGFDGTKVLIPRGSKLFGEYKAEVSAGQNRALIRWRRLTRPDGSIIDLDSPSADPLGRAGIKGKVNSHFFARFGGAILQSTLDLGVQLAARKAGGNTVILGLPGSTQVSPIQQQQIRPTLKVANGTSISVLVMRDLDFTDVEL